MDFSRLTLALSSSGVVLLPADYSWELVVGETNRNLAQIDNTAAITYVRKTTLDLDGSCKTWEICQSCQITAVP